MTPRNSYPFPSFQAQAPPSTASLVSSRKGLTVSFSSVSTVSFASVSTTTDESETSTIVVDPQDAEAYERTSLSRTIGTTPSPKKKNVTFCSTDDVINPTPIHKSPSGLSRVFSEDLKQRLTFNRSSPPRTTADGGTVHPRGRDHHAIKKKLSSSAICEDGRANERFASTGRTTSDSSSSTLVDSPLPRTPERVPSLPAKATPAMSSHRIQPPFKHGQHRTHILKKVTLSTQHTCVTLLDSEVDDNFPSQHPLPSAVSPQHPKVAQSSFVFKETKNPSVGVGMFANVAISHNALINIEYPITITPYVMGVPHSQEDIYKLIFEKLGADGLLSVYDLCGGSRVDGSMDGGSLCKQIVCNNSLVIHLLLLDPNDRNAELTNHQAVFLNAGRMNHSCSPNSSWKWDTKTWTLELRSVRDIQSGEEITIAYIHPSLSYKERRWSLEEIYGFKCLCSSCLRLQGFYLRDANGKLVNVDIERSDEARYYLAHFWNGGNGKLPSFQKWCDESDIPSNTLIEAHKNALNLIQREGLEVLDTFNISSEHSSSPQLPVGVSISQNIVRHADAIAMCYGALKDTENFQLWINLCLDARLNNSTIDGSNGTENEVFRRWHANPHSFPVWGWRKHVPEREKGCSKDS